MLLEIQTERLKLLPFTKQICEQVLANSTSSLASLGIIPGDGWPDFETMDTLPRILNNLSKVASPTGFESWMVIHKNTHLLIGDIGFKGLPNEYGEIDLGYGIILSERQKGYAKEAASGLMEWAFKQPGIKAITANCAKDNLASQKTLVALRFNKVEAHDEMIYWKSTQ